MVTAAPSRDAERSRRRARKAALAALYAAEVGGADAVASLDEDAALGSDVPDEFARRLVRGVGAGTAGPDGLDAWIADAAVNWTIDRMPPVDLTILRIALHELRECPDVPPGATINEAVELAKCYSTTDSSRFVNGLLGRLAVRAGRVTEDEATVDDVAGVDGDVDDVAGVDDGPGN